MGVKLKVLKKCVVTKWSPFGHHSISVVKKVPKITKVVKISILEKPCKPLISLQ